MTRKKIITMADHSMDESWLIKTGDVREKTTAGGVVSRVEDGRAMIALIEKSTRGGIRYSLPKGKVKKKESIKKAAKREIHEETGIVKPKTIRFLAATERFNSKRSIWKTNHFYLFLTKQVECVPLEENKIVRWFPIDELPPLYWSDQGDLLNEYKQEIVAKIL